MGDPLNRKTNARAERVCPLCLRSWRTTAAGFARHVKLCAPQSFARAGWKAARRFGQDFPADQAHLQALQQFERDFAYPKLAEKKKRWKRRRATPENVVPFKRLKVPG
jgi:hypothetical protein